MGGCMCGASEASGSCSSSLLKGPCLADVGPMEILAAAVPGAGAAAVLAACAAACCSWGLPVGGPPGGPWT